MAAYFTRDRISILNGMLQKIARDTPITATSPGSVVRSIAESIANEFGNLYSVLDFNLSLKVLSSAQGQALDLIGQVYNVKRKTLTDIAALDQSLGVFYFYIDAPYYANITIPNGTAITTNIDTFIGQQYSYATTQDVMIAIGRTRAYASIRPLAANSVFTAGSNTLTVIDSSFTQPLGVTVKCTNPKPIVAQLGYESDDSYRARIIGATQASAGGTLDAVRLAALAINGVRDVTILTTAFGMGSFDVVVVPEDNRLTPQILFAVTSSLLNVKPVGVAMNVRQPTVLPMDVSASIVIAQNTLSDPVSLLQTVQIAIIRYINSLLVGSTFVYNQMVEAILQSNDLINDVSVTSMSVNGTQVLRQNYTPNNDEQIIPGAISVVVANTSTPLPSP